MKVITRSGATAEGKFVTEHTGQKGSYLEVEHDGKSKKYRAANVTAA